MMTTRRWTPYSTTPDPAIYPNQSWCWVCRLQLPHLTPAQCQIDRHTMNTPHPQDPAPTNPQPIHVQIGSPAPTLLRKLGRYNKLYVTVASLALTIVTQKYIGVWWLPLLIAVAGSYGVHQIPNMPKISMPTIQFHPSVSTGGGSAATVSYECGAGGQGGGGFGPGTGATGGNS